jgi:hypothetical protein
MRTATPSAVAPVEIQATGRQRREGSRPWGKSRSRKIGPRTIPGTQIQVPSQAAKALLWDDRIGSLEAGKQADIVLIDIQDWRYEGVSRPLTQFLALGSSGDIETVLVDGRVLVEAGRSTGIDERALTVAYRAAVASATARNFPSTRLPTSR